MCDAKKFPDVASPIIPQCQITIPRRRSYLLPSPGPTETGSDDSVRSPKRGCQWRCHSVSTRQRMRRTCAPQERSGQRNIGPVSGCIVIPALDVLDPDNVRFYLAGGGAGDDQDLNLFPPSSNGAVELGRFPPSGRRSRHLHRQTSLQRSREGSYRHLCGSADGTLCRSQLRSTNRSPVPGI